MADSLSSEIAARLARGGIAACLLLASAGCADKAPDAASAPAWAVEGEPELRIGVAEGEPALELHRAGDAVRLGDGRIIVANTGTSELRVFDASGRYLRTIGRRGSGPGEYVGGLTLTRLSGDSLVVHDAGNGRFTVLDRDGGYAGTLAIGNQLFPWDDWLTGNTWVSGVRDLGLRPCAAAALERAGAGGDGSVRRAILDELGALWVREIAGGGRAEWRIVDLAGEPLGSVRLPADFEPYQIGGDFIVGRSLDADGAERIDLYRFTRGERQGSRTCSMAGVEDRTTSVPAPELRADLMNAVVAQEVWFANHGEYSASADSLDWTSESGAGLTIAAHTPSGWMGILSPTDASQPTCAIAVGDATPPGWLEGAPMCAERRGPR